jgi:DNA-binding helix-hairpin-helix protein with protein kinase domain
MLLRCRRVSDGHAIDLDDNKDLLGKGGEGAVFTLRPQPDQVAKVYHAQQDPARRRPKLEAMLQNPPDDNATPGHTTIVWPLDLLVSASNGDFMGFTMKRIPRAGTYLEFANPLMRRSKHAHFTFRDLLVVGRNVVAAFSALHQKGYVVGDVNEMNLMISDVGLITMVDSDSFQVPNPNGSTFRCRVGRPEFTPPELQGRRYEDFDRSVEHDLFGMTVLLFQLLMEGHHPFSGVPPNSSGGDWSMGRRIVEGNFPFGQTKQPLKPPPHAPKLGELHPKLQELFDDCFVAGKRDPSRRPGTTRWKQAFGLASAGLTTCRHDPSHFYDNHLRGCPWCEREANRSNRQAQVATTAAQSRSSSTGAGPLATFLSPAQPPRIPIRPAPPPPPPEIEPGSWRLIPNLNNPLAQAYGVNADQVYHLHPDGSMQGEGMFQAMGFQIALQGSGAWSYDAGNKILILQGMFHMKGGLQGSAFGGGRGGLLDGLLNMYGGNPLANVQLPPQPIFCRLQVGASAGRGRYYTTDLQQGAQGILAKL